MGKSCLKRANQYLLNGPLALDYSLTQPEKISFIKGI